MSYRDDATGKEAAYFVVTVGVKKCKTVVKPLAFAQEIGEEELVSVRVQATTQEDAIALAEKHLDIHKETVETT